MTTTTLPALTGTPKQIAWAEKIRPAKIAEIEANIADLRAYLTKTGIFGVSDPAQRAEIEAGIAEREALITKTSAAWWIDRRDTGFAGSRLMPRLDGRAD